MAVFNFNATQFDPAGNSVAFPIGIYNFEIIKAEMKPVKDNPNSGYLELTYKCLDGDMAGNTQAHRFNLYHENQQTVQIAQRQLSAVAHVIGRPEITDTNDFVGGYLKAVVGPQDRDPKYSDVKKVMDRDGNEAVKGKPYGGGQAGNVAAAQASAAPAYAPAQQTPAPTSAAPAQPAWAAAPAVAPATSGSLPPWAQQR